MHFMPGLSPRIRRQFVPDLHLVPIRIGEEDVRLSGNELAPVLDLSARALDGAHGLVDVARVSQTEPKVLDAAGASYVVGALLQDQNVARSGCLRLDELWLPINGQHPEHVVVELERSLEIAHCQREMGQSERFYHHES